MELTNKSHPSDEVLLTHVFNASREAVYRAWTDPVQLIKWFAPRGCTIYYKQLDIREGGSFLSCVQNPSFGDCWTKGVYKELAFPERIVFSNMICDEEGNTITPEAAGHDPSWPGETQVTIMLEDLGGKTKLTLRQNVPMDLARQTGAFPSWIEMLERLENLLEVLPAGHGTRI